MVGEWCAAGVIAFGLQIWAASVSMADDLDRAEPYRAEVNGSIDVLAASKATPSAGCLSALNDMHTTDDQLKTLVGQSGDADPASAATASEQGNIAVARDVLASDLQVASDTCRPEAERICSTVASAGLAKLCEALHLAIEKAPAGGQ